MTPPHGTRYRFAAGCVCAECHAAHRSTMNRRARRRAMGQSVYTPAAPVREHVRSLMDAGMGYPQLAKVSGVDQSSLIYLMCGKSTRTGRPPEKVLAANARALLAVAAPELADGARVVRVGVQRRAQALVAGGWGIAPLAREIPMSVTILRRIIAGQPVWKASADLVVAAYDRLWDRVPPQETARQRSAVTQARMLAARNGWARPMCWDDDSIDDPAARPDTGSGAATELGRVHLDEVEHLRGFGLDDDQIAARLRVAPSSVRTAVHRREQREAS